MSRIDSEQRVPWRSRDWVVANYPRLRTDTDIISNDPITSCLAMEETYVTPGPTIVPVEGSELASAELARTPGDEPDHLDRRSGS